MGKQYNKEIKRRRRLSYLKRRKERDKSAVAMKKTAPKSRKASSAGAQASTAEGAPAKKAAAKKKAPAKKVPAKKAPAKKAVKADIPAPAEAEAGGES